MPISKHARETARKYFEQVRRDFAEAVKPGLAPSQILHLLPTASHAKELSHREHLAVPLDLSGLFERLNAPEAGGEIASESAAREIARQAHLAEAKTSFGHLIHGQVDIAHVYYAEMRKHVQAAGASLDAALIQEFGGDVADIQKKLERTQFFRPNYKDTQTFATDFATDFPESAQTAAPALAL